MEMETKRVKVLVAIDVNGDYAAVGGWSEDLDALKAGLADGLEDGERYYWIEADVPVPLDVEAGTIIGDVREVEP
jgi:phosphoribosylformimino-5-aminoimidazole carboxamide ribonucleotide (ProFAR) isomerase